MDRLWQTIGTARVSCDARMAWSERIHQAQRDMHQTKMGSWDAVGVGEAGEECSPGGPCNGLVGQQRLRALGSRLNSRYKE